MRSLSSGVEPRRECEFERPVVEVAIPLWIVGSRRPVDRERRKDPGALHRHIQSRSGVVPAGRLGSRASDPPSLPPRLVRLWSTQ